MGRGTDGKSGPVQGLLALALPLTGWLVGNTSTMVFSAVNGRV
jgi:hypothetical protein